MNDLVAKRYVKALVEGREVKALTALGKNLNEISTAFTDEKFNSIVSSPEVSDNQKVELITSLVKKADASLTILLNYLVRKEDLIYYQLLQKN